MHYLTRIVGGLTVLIALASCRDGSVAGVAANKVYFGMQEQSVPLLAGKTTHGSVMLINDSDNAIDNISYQAIVNGSDELKNQVLIESNSCSKILAHSSCSVPFAVSIATENMMSGSAVVVASYANQQQQKVNQSTIVEYGVSHDGRVSLSAGPILPTLNAKQATTYYATLYVVNPESSDYVVQNLITSSADSQLINSGALTGTTIAANSVAALPIEVNTSVDKINLQLALNNPALNDSLILNTSLTAITPVGNGAILVSGTLPVIYSDNTLNASFTIYNVGNATATLTDIAAGSGFSVVSGSSTCSTIAPSNTLAPNSSCTIALTISQSYSGSANLSVKYTGGTSAGTTTLTQNVQWIYAYEPNISVISTLSQYSVYTPTSSSGTVTITNFTKYPFTITNVQGIPIAGMGNAAATTTGNCTGMVLNVNNPSCTTTLNVTGVGQMTLTATGTYLDKNGNQHTSTHQAFNLANVYAAGTWNPWGTSESNNSITWAALNAIPNSLPYQNLEMAISPVNNQPYVIRATKYSYVGAYYYDVFTYNGIKWTQVGQRIATGATADNQAVIAHIVFNPVTKIPWISFWQQNSPNFTFESYNVATNTWILAAPSIAVPTADVSVTFAAQANNIMMMAFDSVGNLYVTYPTAGVFYISKLQNGGSTWSTRVAISSNTSTGRKLGWLAIQPGTDYPWIAYYDTSGTVGASYPIRVKAWNGSTYALVSPATGVYASIINGAYIPNIALAFDPVTREAILVGTNPGISVNGLNIYVYKHDSTTTSSTWTQLGAAFGANSPKQPQLAISASESIFVGAENGPAYIVPQVYQYSGGSWLLYGSQSQYSSVQYNSIFGANLQSIGKTSLGFGANNELMITYGTNVGSVVALAESQPSLFVDVFHS